MGQLDPCTLSAPAIWPLQTFLSDILLLWQFPTVSIWYCCPSICTSCWKCWFSTVRNEELVAKMNLAICRSIACCFDADVPMTLKVDCFSCLAGGSFLFSSALHLRACFSILEGLFTTLSSHFLHFALFTPSTITSEKFCQIAFLGGAMHKTI